MVCIAYADRAQGSGARSVQPAHLRELLPSPSLVAGNAIDHIALPPLPELKCLFLQQNMIWEIGGLENAPNLDTLNLNNNNISKARSGVLGSAVSAGPISPGDVLQVENLGCCPKLSTLLLAHNRLEELSSVEGLLECPSITSLDLTHNKLSDPAILDIIKRCGARPNGAMSLHSLVLTARACHETALQRPLQPAGPTLATGSDARLPLSSFPFF